MSAPLKRWSKKLVHHRLTQSCVAALIAAYIRLVWRTSAREIHLDAAAAPYVYGGRSAIFCFWHGRLLMQACMIPKGRQMQVLISHHRDGRLIADTVARFGIKTVHGSTSKGARAALKKLMDALAAGVNIGITPDGPRGPFQQAQGGAAQLARLANAPLLPASYSASRHKRMGSWDRFMLPYPFCKLVFCIGAPIYVKDAAGKATVEEATQTLQASLTMLTQQADAFAGVLHA